MSKTRVQLPAAGGEDLARWTHIRHFAVSRSMIERATRAREAGDWRAACAASNVDVAFDLAEVGRKYGKAVAERLEDDLRHLVPDLVRWYLPRVDSDNHTLLPDTTCVLATYGDVPTDGPFLTVHTPDGVFTKQRLRLVFGPLRLIHGVADRVWWTGLRHLWDARCTDELRIRCGGGDRAPFFEADGTPRPAYATDTGHDDDPAARTERVAALHHDQNMAEAFATAGVDVAPLSKEWALGNFKRSPIAPTQWTGAMAALAPISNAWTLRRSPTVHILDGSEPGKLHHRALSSDEAARLRSEWRRLPAFPELAWRRPIDLDLLADGRITPDDLHPLVHTALFPKRSTVDGQVGPPAPQPPKPVRVRCRGEWHHVTPAGGTLQVPHDAAEVQRELTFGALSGKYIGCIAARQAWSQGGAQLSRGLQRQRFELFARVRHGDTEAVEAMLDAGFDHTVPDFSGRTLLHHLWKVDHERLLPRLLAGGLDITARDANGRTPLQFAAKNRASPVFLRALIEAGGADTDDAWNWVVPAVIRAYERIDPDFAAELSTKAGGTAATSPGEQDA